MSDDNEQQDGQWLAEDRNVFFDEGDRRHLIAVAETAEYAKTIVNFERRASVAAPEVNEDLHLHIRRVLLHCSAFGDSVCICDDDQPEGTHHWECKDAQELWNRAASSPLPAEPAQPYNVIVEMGTDSRNLLIITDADGRREYCDHGEPEDNSFFRDYKWITEELRRAAKRPAPPQPEGEQENL